MKDLFTAWGIKSNSALEHYFLGKLHEVAKNAMHPDRELRLSSEEVANELHKILTEMSSEEFSDMDKELYAEIMRQTKKRSGISCGEIPPSQPFQIVCNV